ncbi:MAG: DUF3800 domain-containing protein [Deltaproteobacteria bacterium]|uniref:DUF3800 domain-containing protein n=1 Tax=Candidatus Zymogenus saltonus TaxID=2844893 RepID=A0A9D8PPD0_9DELT|nr:DUF3800 domain-containing protein [Candidatus Zymogenus saltonus]
MYIDEVGNSDLGASKDPNHRFLSLTGLIMSLDYVSTTVFPRLEAIKKEFFESHPDNPIILHRKELVNRRHHFQALRDSEIEKKFNEDLLSLLSELDYVVITVTIDKLEFKTRYEIWRHDPYHYCLTILMERFVLWLKRNNSSGDVLAESRGGREDRRLKSAFEYIYNKGTDYIDPVVFKETLTSKQLKVKSKSNNIAGLQLADIIAHPSLRASIARHNGQDLPDNFGGKIAEILERKKYDRSPNNQIEGWGRKWLP